MVLIPGDGSLREQILRAARSDRTVLLIGESGTGKELVAQMIHRHSLRATFDHICEFVARELSIGRKLWRSFYQSGMSLKDIVRAEYCSVPYVDAAQIWDDSYTGRYAPEADPKNWVPAEHPEYDRFLKELQQEVNLPAQSECLYRSILRILYCAWRQNVFFNFFEYDSGASVKGSAVSELFGVVSEKFTDVKGGPGRFQVASHCGGTLFLDNIHHLDSSVQQALLKATEIRHADRRVSRVGSAIAEPIQVRIIVATTVDLNNLVDSGAFLKEWAARVSGQVIRLPTLRERLEDIPLLAHRFADLYGKSIDDDALGPLASYDWRDTNVRGLQNVVEDAADRADGAAIRRQHVEEAMREAFSEVPREPMTAEKVMILDVLRATGGSKSDAARRVGWTRQKLYRMMKRYGIPVNSYGR